MTHLWSHDYDLRKLDDLGSKCEENLLQSVNDGNQSFHLWNRKKNICTDCKAAVHKQQIVA